MQGLLQSAVDGCNQETEVSRSQVVCADRASVYPAAGNRDIQILTWAKQQGLREMLTQLV